MRNETLKSIKENRYSYSSPTIEEGAQKLLDLKEENARLKELLNEFTNALEYAVKQEPRLIYFEQIQSCIKKISRVVQGE